MKFIMPFELLIILVITTGACSNSKVERTMPPKIPIPESMIEILSDVIKPKNGLSYFPSLSKTSHINVDSPSDAFEQALKLYPKKMSVVECWTEFNKNYVFSLRLNPETKNSYLFIIYITKGGQEFNYFHPNT